MSGNGSQPSYTDLPQTPFGALARKRRELEDEAFELVKAWERQEQFDAAESLRRVLVEHQEDAFKATEEFGIAKEGFRHEAERVPGDTEFWILGICGECGFRVAVPGEGMHFPDCPVCEAPEKPLLPQRAKGQGFGDSLGAVARIMPEGDALAAVNRGAQVQIEFRG